MTTFETSVAEFLEGRRQATRTAGQTVALQLACGIDLDHALRQSGSARAGIIGRVRRALRRERIKGICGRADYNLNRHIALKSSLERLCGPIATPAARENEDGARRRRR